MFPMDRKPIAVVIEYDARGKRVRREFADSYTARQFYVRKDRDGRRPAVVAKRQIVK